MMNAFARVAYNYYFFLDFPGFEPRELQLQLDAQVIHSSFQCCPRLPSTLEKTESVIVSREMDNKLEINVTSLPTIFGVDLCNEKPVAMVLRSIPVRADTVESEGRQMMKC